MIKKCKKNQALGKKFLKTLLTAGKTELARYAGFEQAVFLFSYKERFLITTILQGALFIFCLRCHTTAIAKKAVQSCLLYFFIPGVDFY
ncbi:hypothetical protein [Cardinium endosymbiont of Bemisia tabaci]|uniref:hypothetical protein n=1 Tax=Cardinium endosymbiont of Bemisia tabaci TaxID=672794 RepID=UPI000442D32F|nr:hypothetical protein [Cardinium endosymbiont of Bemisia tabaci]CDG49386.1 Hypothetical protein CHV_a0058 [Cardinium endosymbiont cBtQ1 of Bemisia tabaci]